MVRANCGEIWLSRLDPVQGHEQGGTRPVLIVSTDTFNHSPAELVVVVPLTTHDKRNPLHVQIKPPEAGLSQTSYAKCEDIRSISHRRLVKHYGNVPQQTLEAVMMRLRRLFDL